ncbi:hypothetical protein ACTTAK_06655 [Rhodobacter capsulatus]|uniref:hypothetical protein n=1 Tax=Rhodobacter capsulatus TaxID=1061 RepID=UPI001141387C|nr:hypothetical protein [Rhodobacter capsulatus]TQD37439.1 hypothetical protein FKW81_02340 [Rhodobacter capsulatus]
MTQHLPHIVSTSAGFSVAGVGGKAPKFESREQAEDWLADHFETIPEEKRPKDRACMCCGKPFLSRGFHNRLCDRCRGAGSALSDEVRPALPKGRGR